VGATSEEIGVRGGSLFSNISNEEVRGEDDEDGIDLLTGEFGGGSDGGLEGSEGGGFCEAS
jgi:hypothetical protein